MTTTTTKTCPTCGNDTLRPGTCDGTLVIACCCGYFEYVGAKPARESALKLPGLDRGKQSRQIDQLESDRQRYIVAALQREGCVVMEIGKFNAHLSGTTEGCPDVFFTKPTWGMLWQPLEAKRRKGRASTEQQRLIDLGVSVRVETAAEALAIMRQVDERMKRGSA